MRNFVTVFYFIIAVAASIYISGFNSYTLGFWDYKGFPFPWYSGANEGVIYPGSGGLSRNINYFYFIVDVLIFMAVFTLVFLLAKKLFSKKTIWFQKRSYRSFVEDNCWQLNNKCRGGENWTLVTGFGDPGPTTERHP